MSSVTYAVIGGRWGNYAPGDVVGFTLRWDTVAGENLLSQNHHH